MLLACAIALIPMLALHVIMMKVLGDYGQEMVLGSYRWSFWSSMLFQGVMFPVSILIAIVHAGSVGAWLALPAIEARSSAVAIAPHAMLLAYMLRDLFWPLDAQIFAHHVICGILCYLSVSGNFPEMPPNLWMTGGFGLECGSLVVNVYRMRPQWRRFKRTAPWLMGAS